MPISYLYLIHWEQRLSGVGVVVCFHTLLHYLTVLFFHNHFPIFRIFQSALIISNYNTFHIFIMMLFYCWLKIIYFWHILFLIKLLCNIWFTKVQIFNYFQLYNLFALKPVVCRKLKMLIFLNVPQDLTLKIFEIIFWL